MAGVDMYPLPDPLVAACNQFGAQTSRPVLCPTILPRPTRALNHTAFIPDTFHVFPLGRGSEVSGVDISYSAEAGAPRLNQPERFVHFDVQIRSEDDRLPPQVRPARLAGFEGLYTPATSRLYSTEPYFGNHDRFFWRDEGVDYAATLHDFGPRTRAVLAAIVRGLEPAQRVDTASRLRVPGVRTIDVPLGPVSLAAGASGVWVSGMGEDASQLLELDASGKTTRGPWQVSKFLGPVAVAADHQDVWLAQAGFRQPDLLRLDGDDGRFAPGRTAGMALVDLALTDEDIWALDLGAVIASNGHGTLERLHRGSGRTITRIPVGPAPAAVAVSDDRAWVTNSSDGTLSRIDMETNRVSAIEVGRSPVAVAVGAGAVWVANADGNTVSKVDEDAARVTKTIKVGRAPRAVAFGEGNVWVANYLDDTVSRIDPDSGRVIETIAVGAGPSAITTTDDWVWVGNRLDWTISRIGP